MHSPRRIAVPAAAALLLAGAFACRPEEAGRITVRRPAEIEFTATVHARPFDGGWMMPGYHAVVSKNGRMAHAALLVADVTDVEILNALEALGARSGGNLPMDAWEKRNDPRNPSPDGVIGGAPLQVLLRLPGKAVPVPLADVLEDRGARGLDLRLAGNRANIPKWRSGCVVCLYSCPGGKIGNTRYTVRDWSRKVTRFRTRRAALPPDGTRVGVILRLNRGV
ncbi:MAG: YdjY domain-containing protein [Acidobacteriota bacterium]